MWGCVLHVIGQLNNSILISFFCLNFKAKSVDARSLSNAGMFCFSQEIKELFTE